MGTFKRNLLSAVFVSVLIQPAFAQEATDSQDTAARTLDTVVVTATKRAENLQDVPIAITALTSESLDERGITNLAEAALLVPNLKLNHGRDSAGQATIHIRGVGQSDEHGDPGVGIYVDGVFLARSYGALFDLYDLERVEVLRGPQGTLFGRNTIGGAISLVTKKPGNEEEFSAEVGYESFDGLMLRGSAQAPLIEDVLSARISIAARGSDGYTYNVLNNEALNNSGMIGGRAAFRFTPTPRLIIDASVEKVIDEANAPASFISSVRPGGGLDFVEDFIGPISDYVIGGPAGVSLSGRPRTALLDASNDSRLDVWGANLTGEYAWDNLTFKSITGFRETENTIRSDLDGSPLVILDQRSEDFTQNQFSQEFQLIGDTNSGKVKWLLGAYYFSEEQSLPIVVSLLPALGADLDFERTVNQEAVSTALFGSLTYALTDRMDVTVGGRYTDEEKKFNALRRSVVGGVVTFNEPGISDNFSDFAPRVTVDYDFSDETMVYVTASKGFKSGGFNTRAASSGQTQFFKPEKVINYETGLKTRFGGGIGQLNVSAFYMDYTDIQQQAFFVNNRGDLVSSVTNAAEATVKGIEGELLLAATSNLELSASIGYTDAQFDKFVDANAGDLSNLSFQDTPELTGNIGATYTIDLANDWSLKLVGDYSYQSETFFDRSNAPEIAEDGFGLTNISATLSTPKKNFDIVVYVHNLFDEEYRVSGVNLLNDFGYGLNYYGEPRVIGGKLRFKY